ncbi:hypothetical protein JBL43_20090 [Aureibaculum sp. A20]|uniref:Anti-sigma factor n=1 Tax=Aureibaculum flavum TaxID=2795986 RepID=A0ABS0WX52_9FLAO|nr:hypothetical protein [Aureibaculum flavum]MBJ2176555.1 hypothetical protein [Aureibaculum flavum]
MKIDRKVEIIYLLLNELESGDVFDLQFSKLKNEISLDEYRIIESELIRLKVVDVKTEPNGNTLNGLAEFIINAKGLEIRENKKAIKKILANKKPLDWYRIIPICVAVIFGSLGIYQKYSYNSLNEKFQVLDTENASLRSLNLSLKSELVSLKADSIYIKYKLNLNKEKPLLDTLKTKKVSY